MEDVLTVLPFSNTIEGVYLYGEHVLEMLEHSVSGVESNAGGFLQFSGIFCTIRR